MKPKEVHHKLLRPDSCQKSSIIRIQINPSVAPKRHLHEHPSKLKFSVSQSSTKFYLLEHQYGIRHNIEMNMVVVLSLEELLVLIIINRNIEVRDCDDLISFRNLFILNFVSTPSQSVLPPSFHTKVYVSYKNFTFTYES